MPIGDGRFQVYNDADIPLTVVLEPHSFTVDSTGKAIFRKLDPGLHVQLSTTSFHLAPNRPTMCLQGHEPSTGLHLRQRYRPVSAFGLKLADQLPHTVYLVGRKPLDQSEVSWNRAELSLGGGKRWFRGSRTAPIQPDRACEKSPCPWNPQ